MLAIVRKTSSVEPTVIAVLVLELRALLAAAVDGHTVRRAEVEDPVGGAFLAELRVAARDVRVREPDVAVLRAPDDVLSWSTACCLPFASSVTTSGSTPSSTGVAACVSGAVGR